jgi:hypothetical protein
VSNPTTFEDGRNGFTEEVFAIVPDCLEAADRLDEIEHSMSRHLADFDECMGRARKAVMGFRHDIEMLHLEVRDDRAELQRRLEAARKSAERMGYPFLVAPKIRVVQDITETSS